MSAVANVMFGGNLSWGIFPIISAETDFCKAKWRITVHMLGVLVLPSFLSCARNASCSRWPTHARVRSQEDCGVLFSLPRRVLPLVDEEAFINCSKHCRSRCPTHFSTPCVWRRFTGRSHLLSAGVSIHTPKMLLSELKHYTARLKTRYWWSTVTVRDPFGIFCYLVFSKAELLWSQCIGGSRHCGELPSSKDNDLDVSATLSQLLRQFKWGSQLRFHNYKYKGRGVEKFGLKNKFYKSTGDVLSWRRCYYFAYHRHSWFWGCTRPGLCFRCFFFSCSVATWRRDFRHSDEIQSPPCAPNAEEVLIEADLVAVAYKDEYDFSKVSGEFFLLLEEMCEGTYCSCTGFCYQTQLGGRWNSL